MTDSESREPFDAPSTVSNQQRVAWVLSIASVSLIILSLGVAAIGVETLYSLRAAGNAFDPTELALAKQLIVERAAELDQLKLEEEVLQAWNQQQIEKWALVRDREVKELASERQKPRDRLKTSRISDMDATSAPRLYHDIFSRYSNFSNNRLRVAPAEQLLKFARLTIEGTRIGHADRSYAVLAMVHTPDDDIKREFIRLLVEHPDPLEGRHYRENDILVAKSLFQLAKLLPPDEHANAVARFCQLYLSPSESITEIARRAVDSVDIEQAAVLASLVAHPAPQMRLLVDDRVPIDSCLSAAVNAIESEEFLRFVAASRWLSEQPVTIAMQEQVMEALAPVMLVPDGSRYLALEIYCRWADASQAESAYASLINVLGNPISNASVADKLITLAIRLELPLRELIQTSHPLVMRYWLSAYIADDGDVRSAVISLLNSSPMSEQSLELMRLASASGMSAQLAQLKQAIERVKSHHAERAE
ncbi:hypothetical protein [Allorhodopirellula heiligendammensis]|uniref:Uncharacterized protein n=1 Tax=Allorhodopirellula heiligendammensis TaxID=2714739 RepID=A0A5C6C468_9BACT|nr:hypothetical protein [Allorhodopirellula heiligendammensis]TWU18777.1 hypothetical protein Poly21_09430 [Allorhodopirellula heiligendammensis]